MALFYLIRHGEPDYEAVSKSVSMDLEEVLHRCRRKGYNKLKK